MSALEHLQRGTFQPSRHAAKLLEELPPSKWLDEIGPSPRARVLAGEVVAPAEFGEHFARFAGLCRHTIGQFAGEPFILEPWQQEFVNEALRMEGGRRVYRRVVLGIPRKNGKSTLCAALALYLASPADGEAEPHVVLTAGSKEQADACFGPARAFAETSPALSPFFRSMKMAIECPSNRGIVRRVAADGKLNHGLNPYAVIVDELHAFTTPKQIENWHAMTTAQGARSDDLVVVITTASSDLHSSLLGQLYKAAMRSGELERREGLWIARNRSTGMLAYWFSAGERDDIADLDVWERANPASWRTRTALEQDRDDEFTDEPTKRRLFLNQWTSAKERWISHERWREASAPSVKIPERGAIFVGIDAALSGDTTAVVWGHKLEDGRVVLRARVWSANPDAEAHVRMPGGRIDLEMVEQFVVHELAAKYAIRELVYDPRFFDRSAQTLSEAGITVAPLHQGSVPMADAYQSFYDAVMRDGRVLHDGDEVFAAHVGAAAGQKTERGWKVSKLKSSNKIDALIAAVMAHSRAARVGDRSAYERREMLVLG